MTPAINLAKKQNIAHLVHQYKHDPNHPSFGLEAIEALGHEPEKVFKTLLFCINGEARNLAVAVIPVMEKLNLKQAAKAVKGKKAEMADPEIAQKTTGYVVGGISPLGQKKKLPTYIDASAIGQKTICVSAGRRGLEIELSPENLAQSTQATFFSLT